MTFSPRAWQASLSSGWDDLRGSFWALPLLMSALATVLGLAVIEIDLRLAPTRLRGLQWLEVAGPEGARAVLSTIAGSMITVTGVVFSITVVALTLASSQFGPRLLRGFLRDRLTQLMLGTFLATFLYSLLVLQAVEASRVPHLATAGAVGLSIASLVVLIFFIHHVASSIQASSIIAGVARELEAEIPHLFPEELGEEGEESPSARDEGLLRRLEDDAVDVASPQSGYLRVLDEESLLAVAVEHDVTVRLCCRPGHFVGSGAPLLRAGPGQRVTPEVSAALCDCFAIGDHRTAMQDLGFLIAQLVEMAVRALSPGVNDPATAIACIHRLGAAAAALSARRMPDPLRRDAEGTLRVVVPAASFEDLMARCFAAVRRYGAADAEVAVALLGALEGAGAACRSPERCRVLAAHARDVLEAHAAAASAKPDLARVEEAFARALRALEPASA